MSEFKHTPEPWYVLDHKEESGFKCENMIEICRKFDDVVDPKDAPGWGSCRGIHIAETTHQNENPCVPYDVARANFDRIVACINACAGVSEKDLEEGLVPKSELKKARHLGTTFGMLIAAATCIRGHDMVLADEILKDASITPDEIRSLDINDYDMEALQQWIDEQEAE